MPRGAPRPPCSVPGGWHSAPWGQHQGSVPRHTSHSWMPPSTNHWEPRLWHGGARAGAGPGGSGLAGRAPAHGSRLPALGVLEYRVLGTDFRAYAVVFTQLELGDEAFSTVELYSEWPAPGRQAGAPAPSFCLPRLLPLSGGGTACVEGCGSLLPPRGKGLGVRGGWGPVASSPAAGCARPPPQARLSGVPPQAGRSRPARRPCSASPSGARGWASSPSSGPSCRPTVSCGGPLLTPGLCWGRGAPR